METFTLLFFVLMLLVAALLVTQTIRRDFKERERGQSELRRESSRARPHATHDALHSPPLSHHAHKTAHAPPVKTFGR